MDKKLTIDYQQFGSLNELDAEDRCLVEASERAAKASYAPYSNFHVGAAVRLANGETVVGANQENAAFPSGLCAERTALYAAGAAYPDVAVCSLAISAFDSNWNMIQEPASPCGACRQVMAQFQKRGGRNIAIILNGGKSILKFSKVEDILPLIFDSI